MLYCLSLSALLLGLSSAHAEADEFPLLFAQPAPRWAWLLGKSAAIALLLTAAALLLVLPTALLGGTLATLVSLAAAAGGVTLALAAVGLGLGFWVRDGVRGLLAALGVWFALLFGTDLLLLAVSGAPWIHGRPGVWVALLMANPLDTLRVTVLFSVEHAAFAGLDAGGDRRMVAGPRLGVAGDAPRRMDWHGVRRRAGRRAPPARCLNLAGRGPTILDDERCGGSRTHRRPPARVE